MFTALRISASILVVATIPIPLGMQFARSHAEPIFTSQSASSYTRGDYQGSIVTADGLTRTFIVHMPSGFPAAKPYPLAFVFHGGFGSGALVEKVTNFNAKADAKGFVVVYPDGVDRNWNDGRGTTNPQIDDVGFIRQLIVTLVSRLSIDEKRIYATGTSNGGMFSQRLGCELADVVAAIGPDVGPMPTNLLPRCKPARPIAVLGIQGGSDPIVPLGGGVVRSSGNLGKGGVVESAATTMNFWATANGCNTEAALVHEPPRVADGTSVYKYSFSDCKNGAPVIYYVVDGMGHAWPPRPGRDQRITGPASQNINATDVMWDFFSAITR